MKFLRVMGSCFLVAGLAICIFVPMLRVMGGIWTGVGILLIFVAQKAAAAEAHRQQLLATGKAGKATVLEVTDTGITVNNAPRVRVRVRIEAEGMAPVEGTTAMLVSRVSVPRHGEVYDVRFDPQNPNDYTFAPESAGASSRSSSLPSAISRPSSGGDTLSQLERLEALREKGALTQAEFEAQKRKVLAQG